MVDYYKNLALIGKKLIFLEPYYGIFLSSLTKRFGDYPFRAGIQPTKTGIFLKFDKKFWDSSNNSEKLGVLLHELLHVCFMHPILSKSYSDKRLFNIAADLEINQYVENSHEDISLPKNIVSINKEPFNKIFNPTEKLKGTNYYYKKLLKDWDKKEREKFINSSFYAQNVDHDWEEFNEMSEAEAKSLEFDIKQDMASSYKEAKSRGIGNLPGSLKQVLEKLIKPKKSPFNWKAYIRRFSNGYSPIKRKRITRLKPNIKFPDNPGSFRKKIKNLLVAWDTSGSVNEKELYDFITLTDSIRKSGVDITVVECDTGFSKKSVYKWKNLNQIKNRITDVGISGRGGTSFEEPIKFMNTNRNKYSALIYFTDGMAAAPKIKPKRPILWVLTSNGRFYQSKESYPGFKIQIPKNY